MNPLKVLKSMGPPLTTMLLPLLPSPLPLSFPFLFLSFLSVLPLFFSFLFL